jgi:hypothetical protein
MGNFMVKNFILILDNDDYPDDGGGIQWPEFFETIQELDLYVENLNLKQNKIVFAGRTQEIKYKPVEYVTKLERE